MRTIVMWLLLAVTAAAQIQPWKMYDGNADRGAVQILDAKVLRFAPRHGIAFTEVSALAYDRHSEKLYGVSDRGLLYTMRVRIESDRIAAVELLDAVALRDKAGRPLHGKHADAEGLALLPGGGLAVSFERRPRIVRYDERGRYVEPVKLPKILRKKKRYRGKNKMLEAVAFVPCCGMVSAPEVPLYGSDETRHTIYGSARRWKVVRHGSLTAMTPMPGGKLLILERDFHALTRRRISVLSRLNLNTGTSEVLLRMDSTQGWHLDNFEGITRIGRNRYVMVSDDNASPLQRTLLVLLAIDEGME